MTLHGLAGLLKTYLIDNRLFKNYKKHGYKLDDETRLTTFTKNVKCPSIMQKNILKVWQIVCCLIFHILLTKDLPFTRDDILAQIHDLNPAKCNGPDGILSKMLLLRDDSIVLPLMLIFNNILTTGVYPEMW